MRRLGLGVTMPDVVKAEHLNTVDSYGDGPGQLRKPIDVCFTDDGNLAVADVYNYRVELLTPDGRAIRSCSGPDFEPRHVACTCHGEVAVVDAKKNCVRLFDPRSGQGRSFGVGQLEKPFGIATDRDGVIYVTDPCARAIRVFTGDGQLVASHTPPGLLHPLGLTADSNGRLLVCDGDLSVIKAFTKDGHFEEDLISSGLKFPNGVCMDDSGNILVANTGQHKVSLYKPDGQFIQDLLTSPQHFLYDPKGLDISWDGKLAVVSWDESKCLIYKVYNV